MLPHTYLNIGNADYIDSLYQAYTKDTTSVEYGWQRFFEGFEFGTSPGVGKTVPPTFSSTGTPEHFLKEIKVLNLINGYRTRGHLFTKTNPVRERRKHLPDVTLETFGLTDADLDTVFNAGVEVGLGPVPLREIKSLLEQTYCQSIGAEYRYIRDPEKLKWLETRMEKKRNTPDFSNSEKQHMLSRLNHAVAFENFLGTKFVGQKRFSLEGAETVIPAFDVIIEKGTELGIEEFIIGMGHRGRLNILANIMQKPFAYIFSEFQGKTYDADAAFGGDVKYHLGYSNDMQTRNGKQIHLSLCPNPSHLETVDAVVEGLTRSKIDFKYNGDFTKIAPVLIHGDASLAGQGIVYEVLQMSRLDGYRTGGTIHLVINNQVGFTTNYKDSRSSTYCTDLAKTVLSPVFHVNGDDVEAVAYVINLAMEYRQTFRDDIFIDILCYRKYGHNESDEPRFTQPILYKAIESHPNPKDLYARKLLREGTISAEYLAGLEKSFKDHLQDLLDESRSENFAAIPKPMFAGVWQGLHAGSKKEFPVSPDTSISEEELSVIGETITTLPANKQFHKKIEKLFTDRRKMVTTTRGFDWAMAEQLAYGSLIRENYRVRFSGEDIKRGTFSHRHAVVTVVDSDEEFIPLSALERSAPFEIYNSLLSEYAVLGFEYGYALANPYALTLWEAQFGDFLNGAQIIVDQYIVSAETKWGRGNGLVLLLPHGYEGQGPEHSSARIERFMELCADNNIQVVNCTTPANFFHVLRRQLHRDFRKPLVVLTPKSLLRHPACISPAEDFTHGGFRELIDDTLAVPGLVERVLFCSGKIYYDLSDKQQNDGCTTIAIVRIEQLYPTPFEQMQEIIGKYANATEFFWVQEEPENMGAWPYLCRKFSDHEVKLRVIARRESGSPATGYSNHHATEQKQIVQQALAQRV
ncbi:MAG TPA: 2-oxoglutarate dehydrogenase E1 component [Puia sp.]|jgi:2-oxoglutarate dehydrogenase E1 component